MCTGCNKLFCDTHFIDHRRWITSGLDELEDIRNALLQKLNDGVEAKRLQASLLSQIKRWEDRTVKKVRQAASVASNQAQQLLATKMKDIQTAFDETTVKLQRCRKLTNFVEKDLEEMRGTFARLQQTYDQITQPSSMKLCIDGSEQLVWETLIYTVNESIDIRAPRECLSMLQIESYHLLNTRLTPSHNQKRNYDALYLERQHRQSKPVEQTRKLDCQGCSCNHCGKCRDWKFYGERDTSGSVREKQTGSHRDFEQVRRIPRATCTYSDIDDDDDDHVDEYLGRYSVHIVNHMCACNRE